MIEEENELIGLIESGCRLYYDSAHDRFRVYDPRTRRLERVSRSLNDLAMRLYSQQRQGKGRGRVEGRAAGSAGMSEVLKTLGKEYSEILRVAMRPAHWFTKVLVEIGWRTMIMVLQYVKIDPEELSKKLEDPKEFVAFVNSHLSVMAEASAECTEAIMKRDRELRVYKDAAKALAAMVPGPLRQVKALAEQNLIAQFILSKYGLLDEYMAALTNHMVYEQLTKPPAKTVEIGVPEEMLVKELSKRLNISEEGARLAVSLISTVSSWDEVREAVSSATSASGSSSDSSNLIQQLTWVLLLKQLNRDPLQENLMALLILSAIIKYVRDEEEARRWLEDMRRKVEEAKKSGTWKKPSEELHESLKPAYEKLPAQKTANTSKTTREELGKSSLTPSEVTKAPETPGLKAPGLSKDLKQTLEQLESAKQLLEMHGFEVKPKKERALEDEYEEELSDEELEELEEEEDENEGVGAEKSEFLDRVLDIVKAIFEDVLRGVRSDNPKNTQVVQQGVNVQKPLQGGSDVKRPP